ncbi:LamG-like jellyroll fold domain-containing protein, partial [candidate division KSB1 bacterium]
MKARINIQKKYRKKVCNSLEDLHKRNSMMSPDEWKKYRNKHKLHKKRSQSKEALSKFLSRDFTVLMVFISVMLYMALFVELYTPTGFAVLEDAEIVPGKEVYVAGDMAHLFIMPSTADYTIEVYDPHGKFYSNALNFPVFKEGLYTITANLIYEDETKIVSASFEVVEDVEEQSDDAEGINETKEIIIPELQQNITNATVNATGETAPAGSTPTNLRETNSKPAGAFTSIEDIDIEFNDSDVETDYDFDEQGRLISVLKMNKQGVKIKIRGAEKNKLKKAWFRKGILHVDSIPIKDATIGIPHNLPAGISTKPRLYIKEDNETEFRLAVPYEKYNKTFNEVRIREDHYEFDVEHFTEYNLTIGAGFSDLTQALFWTNGTDDITLIARDNHSYYNNSDPKHPTLLNSSLFNTTGLIVAYNFENDVESTSVTDYTDKQNGTPSAGVGYGDYSTIMQRGVHLNRTANNQIDMGQNLAELAAGNYSFLIGGLVMYKNSSPSYSNALSVFAQLDAATFTGTGLLYGIGNSASLVLANVAPGGGTTPAQVGNLKFGQEYCIGGSIFQSNPTQWRQTLYVVSKDGEILDVATTSYNPNENSNTVIGQVTGTVDISPNITIGSIAFYNESRNMQFADVQAFCYQRLDRYYGMGEHNDGRINIEANKNVTIANYVLDSDNMTALQRFGIKHQTTNNNEQDLNYYILNNTFYGFDNQLLIGGSSGEEQINHIIRGNRFHRNSGKTAISAYMTYSQNITLEDNLFNATNGIAFALLYSENGTVRGNNFTNINKSWYLPTAPYGLMTIGLTSAITKNHSVYNNWFDDIQNGTAISVACSGCNITNNTFHDASFYKQDTNQYLGVIWNATAIDNVKIYLNNFFGSGINHTEGIAQAADFCVNSEGNFYEENINSSWIPAGDCGPINETYIAGERFNAGDLFFANWTKQSSTRTVTYEIFANKSDGTRTRIDNTTFLNMSVDSSALSSGNYTLLVIPYVNGSRINGTNAESDNFTINSPSSLTSILLNASSPDNMTFDNLTASSFGYSDPDGDNADLNYNWYRDGVSDAVLNMPMTAPDNLNRTYDFSGNDNHGTGHGNVEWNKTAGHNGFGAYSFDGIDDYISAGNDASLDYSNDFTIVAWVKGDHSQATTYTPVVAKSDEDNSPVFELLVKGGVSYQYTATFYNQVGTGVIVRTYRDVLDGNWHQLAAVMDNTNNVISAYVDGGLNATDPTYWYSSYSLSTSAKDTEIGRVWDLNAAYNYLNGSVDDVRIYNRVLSADEISLLYHKKTNKTHHSATNSGENWTVKVTPIDYYGLNGTSIFSNSINITELFLSFANQTPSTMPYYEVNDTAPVNPNQNLTIRVNATAIGGTIANSWIKVWQTVKSAGDVLWEGIMNLVGGFWQVDIPINLSYPTGLVNYTIYANLTGGNYSEIEGNFSVNNAPTITSILLNASSANNMSIDNITATYIGASDPDGHDLTFI